jgi:hypothetical protein
MTAVPYEEQIVALTSTKGGWSTHPTMIIRHELLNDIYGYWLESFHTLTPEQADHIKRAIAFALWEARTPSEFALKEEAK